MKFKKGDQVKYSVVFLANHVPGWRSKFRDRIGTVIGFGRTPSLEDVVYVQWADRKSRALEYSKDLVHKP